MSDDYKSDNFLVLWESGAATQFDTLTDDLKQGALDGVCEIIRFRDGKFQGLAVTDPEEWADIAQGGRQLG